jgi:LysM repeat protein
MKQLGEEYPDERKQIALFGTMDREKSVEYAFSYGAALLGCGKGRTDSLTNSQKEEAESIREEYFPDYQLLGVVISTDSVDENVYWLGNGNKSIPLDGYYIFYDKNEAMLNFMMHNQKEEREIDLDPVIVKKADMDREKREKKEQAEKDRLEMQKQRTAQKKVGSYRQQMTKAGRTSAKEVAKKKNLFPAAACFLVVAIGGVYGVKTLYPDYVNGQNLVSYVSELWDKASVFTNGYLDESEEVVVLENESVEETQMVIVETQVQQPAELDVVIIPELDTLTEATDKPQEILKEEQPVEQVSGANKEEVILTTEPTSQKYLIKKGDSLLRILRNYYGDDSRLAEICDVNGIADPNNIQVGQTILLP